MTRVSLGAQSFQPQLLSVLERQAAPDDVRRAVYALRDANFDNISLDLIYGIPARAPPIWPDIDEALALGPEHLVLLRAGSQAGNAVHARVRRRARQAEAMEGYFAQVWSD